ncbi:toxin [Nodosilinea sp. P-1105]|uniref:Tc toxin subunit A-related protein n=1 Tax=Nodosilinea sp. P-1105 TaxID=2546229 RepID=UPI00146C2AB4|nr:toxin [Nodosilinea sp. P-1105]NMF84109.1 toxin [Nodosilinea sp. P-1105]
MSNSNSQFHNHNSNLINKLGSGSNTSNRYTYTFYNHFHPFVGELLTKLNKESINGLLDPRFLESPKLNQDFFKELYQPNESDQTVKYFSKQIGVSEDDAYSIYNWELFFHVPLVIAVHLSVNQRFAEAQRWFHYIFDPTTNDGQFWRFIAFRKPEDNKQIDKLLHLLSRPEDELEEDERKQRKLILSSYEDLRKHPFQPHVVARNRFLAYQYCVVMKYLDNLIAWGDSLFRQDTIETVNEATQIYVLAANLLGPKPQRIPQRGATQPKTFAQLRAKGLDELGNALVELEAQFPFNLSFPTTDEGSDINQTNSLFGVGRTLYFCIPHNDKLLSYWDTVADRLFKIRHCMNIEGVVRQLPLFDPPIDPGMLVKAAAAGIDISSLVSGLNQPLAPIRSTLLIQKALEICNEVRGMGNALLSALEKKDTEALGLLRQKHEINIQQLVQDVRYLQWKEAEAATESLVTSREIVLERYRFYQRLLGSNEEDLQEVMDFTLERRSLTEENFDEVYTELVGQYAQDVAREEYSNLEVLDEGILFLNQNEDEELNTLLPRAKWTRLTASALDALAATVVFVPNAKVHGHYWGIGVSAEVTGGQKLAVAAKMLGEVARTTSAYCQDQAGMTSRTASYERRADDWMLQSNLAARELMQIGRQIISSLIREETTHHEYESVKKQIQQSQEIDQFLRAKFTNEELYGWMQGELSKLYYEYYKFAFDIARKAEQTMKHELMRPELDDQTFIKFNYWDGGRKGLLSGEALHLDLKRMEMAYHDHNKREYELTKHISLRQLDPIALLALRATGTCEVTLPEWLFDLDCPGHYMRRIKAVSLSIPSVTGPYTSVNCTLSLLRSSLRKSPLLSNETYARQSEDARFIDYFGTIQSVVTSSGNDDSGMFEPNLRDERFLPFEGAGAESTWKLELPSAFRQFDYNSISDVILHVRYTARQGGDRLGSKAVGFIEDMVGTANASGLALLFNLKHDFPSEWSRFVSATDNSNFVTKVKREHFPYITQGRDIRIDSIQLYSSDKVEPTTPTNLDLANYTTQLKDDGEFELSLPPDETILIRETTAYVFMLLRYSLV